MVRKYLFLLLSAAVVFSLFGCSRRDGASPSAGADEKLLTVDVTVPASFFDEDDTEDSIRSAAKEKGFLRCSIHEDGSVTYTMTKAKHRELLADLNASLEEGLYDLVNGESAVPSFKRIEHSDDFSMFDLYVDTEQFGLFDSLYILGLYYSGAQYQAYSGIDEDDIEVTVCMIDDKTGEEIRSYSYQSWLEKTNGQ